MLGVDDFHHNCWLRLDRLLLLLSLLLLLLPLLLCRYATCATFLSSA
jgi:hypothetical protein